MCSTLALDLIFNFHKLRTQDTTVGLVVNTQDVLLPPKHSHSCTICLTCIVTQRIYLKRCSYILFHTSTKSMSPYTFSKSEFVQMKSYKLIMVELRKQIITDPWISHQKIVLSHQAMTNHFQEQIIKEYNKLRKEKYNFS